MIPQSLDAVGFALAAAMLWGLSPIFTKKGLERGGTTVQAATVVIITSGVLFWSALLATAGTRAFDALSWRDAGIFLVGGVFGTTLGRLSNYAGVRRVGASVSTAVINTRPLFAVILAFVVLQETITATTILGVTSLVVGVVVLSMAKGGDIRGWRNVDLAFPLLAALAYAVGNIIRRFGFVATDASSLEAVTLNETAAMLTLGTYLVVRRRDRISTANRAPIPYFVVAGIIGSAALFTLFHALSIGEVSLVDPIAGTAPLFATLFAYVLLRDVEAVTRGVVAGALLVVIGGVLVTI